MTTVNRDTSGERSVQLEVDVRQIRVYLTGTYVPILSEITIMTTDLKWFELNPEVKN
jgi:hypothetical protein